MARMLEDNDYITELVSIRGSVAPVCFSFYENHVLACMVYSLLSK